MADSSANSQASKPEGVIPADLRPGSWIDLETKSRHYRIECLGGSSIRISGHPEYCHAPVPARLQGLLLGQGALQPGFIGCGGKLVVFLNGTRPLITSRVLSLNVHEPESLAASVPSLSIH